MSFKDQFDDAVKRRREEREKVDKRKPIRGFVEQGEDAIDSGSPIRGLQTAKQDKANRKEDRAKRTFSL